MDKALFSSKSTEWETPEDLFNLWDFTFRFDLDVCATPENTKCDRYFCKEQDGLSQVWTGMCWMNPPYGRGIEKWVEKAYNTALWCDGTVVCLLPARTDTRWWQTYVTKATYVVFLPGRIKFVGAEHSAPFPSAIAVFQCGYVG